MSYNSETQQKNLAWVLPRPKQNHYKGGMPLHCEEWLLDLARDLLHQQEIKLLNLFCGMNRYGLRVDIKPGVYACRAIVNGKTYSAVTNIGYRPTFGEDLKAPRIEAHLLDFSGDLYGNWIDLVFIDRLRDEMKFSQVSDLVEQISSDVERAREILAD